jgi:hypothetical protein
MNLVDGLGSVDISSKIELSIRVRMSTEPKQAAKDIQRFDRGVLRQIDTISLGW